MHADLWLLASKKKLLDDDYSEKDSGKISGKKIIIILNEIKWENN